MADDKRSSGPPGGKRRRPPTTIDLKATEVTPEPVQPTEPIDPPQQPAEPEAPPAAASAAAEPAAEPLHEPPQPPFEAKPEAEDRSEPRPDTAATNERTWAAGRPGPDRMNGRLIAAALAGVAAMLVLFLALWVFGPLGGRDADPLEARLAALEKQVRELAARPAPAGVDPRAFANLDARVAKAEQAAAALRAAEPDQALANRIAALEAATRPLSELGAKIDAASAAAREAKGRADGAFEAAQKNATQPAAQAAERKDIDALAARIAALEEATRSVDEKIARAVKSAEADRAGRLAFVATTLRAAAERGEPFEQELAAARSLAPDARALSSLEPFAATGVPRTTTLARELARLSGPMVSAAGSAPREGGILDRLAQNAERLVRIRPISEAPGDDAGTIVARAEAKAAQGDIAGALSELVQLPEPARAPAQAWIKRAEAQIAALAAARALAAGAVGALGKAAP